MSVPTISRDELKQKIDRGDRFTLVETLPEFMYRQRHLPGALNLPPNEVQQRAASVLPDKNAEIVVYCGGFT
jgi:rhodanese-related sulfurtransferase